jgi:hypothetical protein
MKGSLGGSLWTSWPADSTPILVSTRDNQRWLFAAGANQEKYTEIQNMDKVSNKY